MKKLIITALSTIVVATTAMGLTACGKEYKYDFMVDGEVYQSVILDKDFVKPEDPTKTGYTFAGWFIDGSDVAYTDFSVKLEADVQLVAKWTVNQYSISFDTNGAGTIDTITQDYNSSVTAPETPVKEHYDFVGWFEEGASAPYTFNKIEARNVALKAEWVAKEYSITFNTDGGSQLLPLTAAYGSSISAPAVPYKDGYGFTGWYEEGSDVPYVFDTMGENITLTARWSKGYHAVYELYKFSQDLDSRYSNEDDITVEVGGEEYVIGGAAFIELGARPGRIFSIEVDTNVYAHIFVITAKLRTADEVANMFYATSHYLFNAEKGDVPSNVHQHGDKDYLMLDADVDMAGKSIVKSMDPYGSGDSYKLWGFKGTFDGNGHVIYNLNDSMFRKLSKESVVKNLGIVSIDGSSLIAGEIFGIIDNVYINNTIIDSGTSSLTKTLSVDAKVSNTVIVVNNAIGKADAYAVSKDGNNATFVNAFVFTNGNAFETAPGTLPTIYALDGKIDGNLNDFVSEYWDVTGNQPLWLNAKVTSIKDVALYGKYVLNTAKDGREENTADLVVANGDKNITIPASKVSSLGVGKSTSYIIKDGTDFVVVTVKKATAVLKTADDLANWVRLAGGGGSNWGHGTYIMLGEDIDATGVSIYYNQNPYYHEEGWGYTGTFDGNGHTISNLKSGLITVLKSTTIKNLKLVNCLQSSPTGNYMTALTLDNCDFEFDASDIADLMLFASGVAGNTTVSNCKFTIKNATDSTKISFGSSMRASGILTISNVIVTTNAGTFKAIADQTSEYDFTGATTKTIENASFAPIA